MEVLEAENVNNKENHELKPHEKDKLIYLIRKKYTRLMKDSYALKQKTKNNFCFNFKSFVQVFFGRTLD